MKRAGKWVISIGTRAAVILLVILLLPFARSVFGALFPNLTGEIQTHSQVLIQKLQSSNRLEVTRVDETGVLEADTSVILLGTVGKTTIRYRYTASLGIDLSKVTLTTDSDRMIFTMPELEVLNDGIEALEIKRQNFLSHAIDRSTEDLLGDQREVCRKKYLTESEHSERVWRDAVKAMEETLCEWLEAYGERHYEFEFIRPNERSAGAVCLKEAV